MPITTPAAPKGTRAGALAAMTPLPELEGLAPLDLAERLRGLPGMALLESARPGRRARWSYLAADPLEVIDAADDGPDPFAAARRAVARMDPTPLASPFSGGLMGFLGYDVGRHLERLPTVAAIDQWLPALRLGLYDQVVAFDHGTGRAWLASRAVDGDQDRFAARRDAILARLHAPSHPALSSQEPPTAFASNVDRACLHGDGPGRAA